MANWFDSAYYTQAVYDRWMINMFSIGAFNHWITPQVIMTVEIIIYQAMIAYGLYKLLEITSVSLEHAERKPFKHAATNLAGCADYQITS